MKKSWAVTIKAEYEYDYATNAIGLRTIKDERQVDGDDEACDALWAAKQARDELQESFKLNSRDLHVIEVKVKEVD